MKPTLSIIGLVLLPVGIAQASSPAIDATNWKQHARLEISRSRVEDRSRVELAYALKGIDPRVYLKSRKRAPSVAVELRRLNLPAGVLFELYLETTERYPFAPKSAYAGEDWRTLREAERAALRHGVLDALSASDHPAAPFALMDAAVRGAPSDRRVAAASLGATGRGEALLVKLANDGREDDSLRAAALAGLGRLRTGASYDALLVHARSTNDAVRRAAITNLGAYATASARDKVGAANADRAALLLVSLLLSTEGDETALVQAIGRTASPAALDALSEKRRPAAQRAARRLRRALARR